MANKCGEILEFVKGTDLCRVRGEGGTFRGFRKDILTENLSDRESAFLVCSRCQGILREACLSISGEQFCSCCIKKGEEIHPNIHVRNTVLSLKCSCPLSAQGCEWLGTLGECENHLDACGHVQEKCNLGCKIVLPRNELKIHINEKCLQRKIPCEHCENYFKVCDMLIHLSKCDKMPLTCELKCGTVVCRENMVRHLEKECGRVQEKCKLGCEIMLPRDELNKHVNEKCMQRMIPCEHCKGEFKVCDMSNHLNKCDKMPLTCELGCGIVVCREDMARHLEEECVEKNVQCPFIQYKCEVGLVKRKELSQHLEDKRTEHTELKLSAMEEIVMKQSEIIQQLSKENKQTGSLKTEVKQLTHKVEVLDNESMDFKQTFYYVTNVTKLYWRINDIQTAIEKYISLGIFIQKQFQAAGYYFIIRLICFFDANLQIIFLPQSVQDYDSLKWPFKAEIKSRLICHKNPKCTMEFKSNLIEIERQHYRSLNMFVLQGSSKRITLASFHRSDITAEFIKDGGVDFEILVILKQN